MKNIFIFITILSLLVSCEDILDQQVPAHKTVDGNVIKDEATAEVALVGVYSYLASGYYEWVYARNFSHLAGTTRGSGSSDGTNEAGFEGELIYNIMESDHSGYIGIWSSDYKMINGANTMIPLTEKVDNNLFSPERKESIIAEATFLRFFAHFHLFRCFGYFWDINSPYGVLYRTEPSALSNHKQARLTVSETYEQLLEDLDYVIEFGPEITDIYHVSKYTAMAFKAKVLAMRGGSGDYEEVINIVNELMAATPYSPHSDYLSYFFNKRTSTETIFSLHFANNLTSTEIGLTRARTPFYYRATEFLINTASSSEQYLWAVQDTTEGTIAKIANFGEGEEELVANAAFTFMRLSELIVLKAEAVARTTGNAQDVADLLNPLLERAGDTPLEPADYGTKAELLDAVYNVLIKEMGCETGLDWEASLRFDDGAGQPRLIGQKEGLESVADLQRAIMPIPIQELNININLVQNPGYFGSK